MKFIKPKIIISKCLEHDTCRFDGQLINNKYIKKLKKFIEFSTVCPEVEIGMGIPRKPIRIIHDNNKTILQQSDTGIDWSKKMNNFSKKYISEIEDIDGFILKSASPSCGINSTKIFQKKHPAPIGKGNGLFADQIVENFPNHPKEEEKRLNNAILREHFFTSIFTIADFRTVTNFETLYQYHAKHKYLFMSYNQTLMRKMGKIAANDDNLKIEAVKNNYYQCLLILFLKKSRYKSNINTHMHVMGYFKKFLSSPEKKLFLENLELYRDKKLPISGINNMLHSWIVRFDNEYLLNQSFFNPFPKDLIEENLSRFL
tara:strand:+ start:3438 stop:4382 length:945 start_codon:yes stop_codon:yes gene_type:complete